MIDKKSQFTSSFKQILDNFNDVMKYSYVHKYFNTIEFKNRISNTMTCKSLITQKIFNNGQPNIINNGFLDLNYCKEKDLQVDVNVDVNRNFTLRVDKTLQFNSFKDYCIFGKINSNTLNKQIYPQIGFYKNFNSFAFKIKFDLDNYITQIKGKALYDRDEKNENSNFFGTGVAIDYDFRKQILSNIKAVIWNINQNATMSLHYSNSKPLDKDTDYVVKYCLYQKLQNKVDLGIQLSRKSRDQGFGIKFGCKYYKYDNVIYNCKLTEQLFIQSSFIIDLNLRKKDESFVNKSDFPIGLKIFICQ
ncbi:hypothetical protein IMG5_109030 [Ichthyophthirius multifiliis]|uniref:Uncharacterized protein n=1 Tax=Ichthyophthirius multifiliis TaxID=5932 RepID=G0QTK3_ICHMU|nr:hypothetical protein IMG5_109030 [Ichthyophthirius multifiliis]EGR31454.1 hypothetical protein IMG5_109030 [Ichthyophthirius multifiliis]|eukprot:XP_004034940.1 hypothetical protein IMG5_109030 [Ichthyophthirius multifiliis]